MKFHYAGVTRQKENVTGTLDAADEIEARLKLRAMQVRPTRLSEKKRNDFSLEKLLAAIQGPGIDLKGIMVFTRQFSSLIDSGVPVVQCLDILWQQERRPGFKKILAKVKSDIEGGSGLADALGKHPRAFNDFFVRIIEAGEVSGTLDKALQRVGIQLEKLGRIRSKVIGALMYPSITIVVAAGVLMFLLVKVIPEVAKMYGDSNAKLPELTLQVLALSKWVQEYYAYLLGLLVGGVTGFLTVLKMPAFRVIWDPFVLKIPLFGSLIRKATVARFTRTLSTLVSSGVPLLHAFEICVRLIDNLALRAVVARTATMVQEGKGIAQGLAAGGLFPPMVVHMVNIGEMTGKLDELLAKVSDIYDDEVDDAIGNLTGILQPALIVGVGLIIAFLLVSMYLPIFQLAEKVTS